MVVTKLEHIISMNTVTAVWQQLQWQLYFVKQNRISSKKRLNWLRRAQYLL
jgi:hypothetical protein